MPGSARWASTPTHLIGVSAPFASRMQLRGRVSLRDAWAFRPYRRGRNLSRLGRETAGCVVAPAPRPPMYSQNTEVFTSEQTAVVASSKMPACGRSRRTNPKTRSPQPPQFVFVSRTEFGGRIQTQREQHLSGMCPLSLRNAFKTCQMTERRRAKSWHRGSARPAHASDPASGSLSPAVFTRTPALEKIGKGTIR